MYLKQYLILLSLAKKAVQNESIAWGTFFQIFSLNRFSDKGERGEKEQKMCVWGGGGGLGGVTIDKTPECGDGWLGRSDCCFCALLSDLLGLIISLEPFC